MQVTRHRRTASVARAAASRQTRLRAGIAGATVLVVAGGGMAYAASDVFGTRHVGVEYADGLQISDNQVIKPIGDRILTESGKFMGTAVSPNGKYVAASTMDRKVALQIIDLSSKKPIWTVGTADGVNQQLKDLTVGQEGPTYSPDGAWLWLPQADGMTRFPVKADGTLGAPTTFPLAKVDKQQALPAGSVYSPDGATLYVAVNGQNAVAAMDPTTGAVRRTWKVGIAPRQLTFVGGKLYVSNEGGRMARPGETTINSYNTDVPADGYLATTTNGTLSVIDPASTGTTVGSIDVGLHPTAMYVAGGTLLVANTGGDTVSVVDTAKNAVVQTIATKPYEGSEVGYQPSGITVQGDHLLVSLARANAIAAYRFDATKPGDPASYLGLLPTDYYPSDVTMHDGKVLVTNMRGIDARGPAVTFDKGYGVPVVSGPGTHSTTASLTTFALPSDKEIAKLTPVVFDQNGWGTKDVPQAQGNKQAAVPVPTRIGDPSTIKHVFMIVKENRTYDQIHGDDPRGNGDPSLAQFGKTVTPNLHALSTQFGLYDNTYDAGTNSAEGHNWIMQGDDPEYTESSAGEYIRSYDTEDDVLGHQRSGFLWTSIMSAGKSVKNYGEFTQFLKKPDGATWQKYYCAAKSVQAGGDPAQLTDPSIKSDTQSPIPSLNQVTLHTYPKFDVDIPDTYRVQVWKQDFEKNGPADFNMLWLSSDHTGGPVDARAQVADGDLSTGQIVDVISHSKYWADSAIFVVEDDSQDGADHIDGHRAPIQVISPYAAHGKVVSTYYSQINMVRTIQQIFGAQPLNQKLAAATPMFDAFQAKADLTPYQTVPNQIPLTEQIKDAPACGLDQPGQSSTGTSTGTPTAAPTSTGTSTATATAAPTTTAPSTTAPSTATATATTSGTATATAANAKVPAAMADVAKQWDEWRAKQPFAQGTGQQDSAPPELMNRFTWYQAHDWGTPYPGDTKIYAPADVPGAAIPAADNDG